MPLISRDFRFTRTGAVQLAAVLSLCVLVLGGCGKKEAPDNDDDPKVAGQVIEYPANVKSLPGIVGQPVKSGGDRMLSMPGRLVWNEDKTVRVASPFAGRVMDILVQPGTTVKAGQPLAMLTSPDFGSAQADARKSAADSAVASKALARQR
ncbi:MAG: efflux RND transporter periplasmic adaptor subunit, partial [Dyella sp.]|nr:efflux RND transporter periplasmic adaptor subunit [Dyella sp.]